MGFDNCEVGFGKKMNWEMGFVRKSPHPYPLQDPKPEICAGSNEPVCS